LRDGILIHYDWLTPDIDATIEIRFCVTRSTNDILSVIFSGNENFKGAAHPNNVIYGATIDLIHATKLYLSDFTVIDDIFLQKIIQSSAVTNIRVDDNDDPAVVVDQYINLFDLRNLSDMNFYVTPESLNICIGIPYVNGNYAIIETPYSNTVLQRSSVHDNFLSLKTEFVIASFKVETSLKTAAICISEDDDPYIVYRFGTPDNIEFEFPLDKEDSWNQFSYSDETGGGSGSHLLKFNNKEYIYEIYEEGNLNSEKHRVGIRVTNVSTGEVTDIKGDVDSLVGSIFTIPCVGYDKKMTANIQ
jgi:hypothetical protein